MMYLKLIILSFLLTFTGCFDKSSNEVDAVAKDQNEVRGDIKSWIEKEFSGQKDLKRAVEELAQTPPESCDFKYKVECIEKITGFDKALEIELEMMKRVINTAERQKRFDENIEKCHFGQGMNKQVCAHEKREN